MPYLELSYYRDLLNTKRILINYSEHPYKRTVKQFRSLQIAASIYLFTSL